MNEEVRRLSPMGIGVDLVRRTQTVRRLRSEVIAGDLFSDPAWDMLLELFASELAGKTILAAGLARVANVTERSAYRWIEALHQKGLIILTEPLNGDAKVLLSNRGSAQMQRYFSAVATISLPL